MSFATDTAALTSAADRLAHASVDELSGNDTLPTLKDLKVAASQLDAVISRVTHHGDANGAFIGSGARDSGEWLAKATGTSKRKNRTAAELGEAMSRSDELAEAVANGSLSTDKANAAVGAAGQEAISGELLDTIADLPLPSVKPAVKDWLAKQQPDSEEHRAEAQRQRRFLKLTPERDGMVRIDGLVEPEAGDLIRNALNGTMNLSAFDDSGRTQDQRRADALTQLASAASRGDLKGGRSNTKLMATASIETLTERAATRGRTHGGTSLDANTVRKLACDSGIHRVITGPASSILDFGHESRLVSDNLFNALVVRDQHCRWPGCTIQATWCDAHHITEWQHGGATDQQNLVLLCHRHHQMTHQPGWKITGTGTQLELHHPNGSTETSRPPGVPPSASAPRADPIGHEPRHDTAPSPAPPPPSASTSPTLCSGSVDITMLEPTELPLT